MISDASTRALDTVAQREREVLADFVPETIAKRSQLPLRAPSGSYFVSGDPQQRLYSHDATLSLRKGELVDQDGRRALGYARPGAPLDVLRADPLDVALGFTASLRVASDGSVLYDRWSIDPKTGMREPYTTSIGSLAVARFSSALQLQTHGSAAFSAPAGAVPHTGTANADGFGALETLGDPQTPRVDADLRLIRLQEAYLALDALRSAGKAQSSLDKTAMDLLK
ncbi:MAG: hypothetical protein ABR508_05000 [Candidatus Baltobacteraceae bacterium]